MIEVKLDSGILTVTPMWNQSNGDQILVSDMDNEHLENSKRMLGSRLADENLQEEIQRSGLPEELIESFLHNIGVLEDEQRRREQHST